MLDCSKDLPTPMPSAADRARRAAFRSSGIRILGRLTAGVLPWMALAIGITAHAQSRGELLYATHCIACHTSQVHWRDKKLATDWNSLEAQVRRWQGVAVLGWSDADIVDVTRHLNGTFYRFEEPRSVGRSGVVSGPGTPG